MTTRLVVCLRFHRPGAADLATLAERADQLCKRAAALGARVTAWQVRSFAFDFPVDGVEDAIELVAGEPLPEGFSAGIAQGRLRELVESGSRVTLSWGKPLERACALARLARPGEILLDPRLHALRAQELLTRGGRRSRKRRLRGYRLDHGYPLRAAVQESVKRLVQPALLGERTVHELLAGLAPGALCVLSADPGSGGTRVLQEVKRGAKLPALLISPGQTGEPLGALRLSIAQAELETPPRSKLPEPLHAAHATLLAGKAAPLEQAAALVGASVGPGGLLLVDDPADIDRDTLDVLRAAIEQFTLRALVRIHVNQQIPPSLSALPRAAEAIVGPLDVEQRVRLVQAFAADGWHAQVSEAWAARSDAMPLAIREAMAAALESGALIWSDAGCAWRRSSLARRGIESQPAEFWIERRLAMMDGLGRQLLEAVAVLGGRAAEGELASMLSDVIDARERLQRVIVELERRHWLTRTASDVVLTSRSARITLLDSLTPERSKHQHTCAARTLERSGRPLSLGPAALHAWLAGDRSAAIALSTKAAAAASAAGLAATAAALREFTARCDRTPLAGRGLAGAYTWEAAEPAGPRSSGPPPPPRRSAASSAPPKPARVSSRPAPSRPPPSRPALGSRPPSRPSGPSSTVRPPDSEGAPLPALAMQALKDGDWETVKGVIAELRQGNEQSLRADRLEAMLELARGEIPVALRLLREIKHRVRAGDNGAYSRAALALAVALDRAGRAGDALLEALDALASARKSRDRAGERACARFLAQLTERAGSAAAAAEWARVVESS